MLLALWLCFFRERWAVSKAAGANAVSALTNALASRKAPVRRSIAEILGEIGPKAKAIAPFLKGWIHTAEPRVVAQSATAL